MDVDLELNCNGLPGVDFFVCTLVYAPYRQLVLNVCAVELDVNLDGSSLHLAFILLPADITLNVYLHNSTLVKLLFSVLVGSPSLSSFSTNTTYE